MVLLRAALFEARMLRRVAGIPASIAVVLLVLLLHAEEPRFVRIFALQFFWQSLEAGVCTILALLPLVWTLARRPQARTWTQRLSPKAFRPVLVAWVGICLVAIFLVGLAYLCAITVRYNTGERNLPAASWAFAVRSICFAAPLAALAPALFALELSLSLTVFVWLVLSVLSLGLLGVGVPVPLDRILGLGEMASVLEPSIVLTATISTLAGLLLSWAVFERRTVSQCASVS